MNEPLFSGQGIYSLKDIQGLAYCRMKLIGGGAKLITKLIWIPLTAFNVLYLSLFLLLLALKGEIPDYINPHHTVMCVFFMILGFINIFGDRMTAKKTGKALFTKVPVYDNCNFSFEIYDDRILYKNKFTEMNFSFDIADRIYLLDDSVIFVTSETTVTYLPMTSFGYGTFEKAKTYLESAAKDKIRHKV